MAYRLSAAAVVGVLALLACGTWGAAGSGSTPATVITLRAAMRVAQSAFGRYYDVANDAASEAFVSRALARGMPVGRSERCLLPDGRSSTRPTVLANPLLAASSIRQRMALVSTVGAYDVSLEARASAADLSVVNQADRELYDRLATLDAVANTHAQGDLFIEDLARALTRELDRAGFRNETVRRPEIDATEGIVRKLLDVLSTDVARQRIDTVDAAALAYRSWAIFTKAAHAGHSGAHGTADPPSCSEPTIYARDAISSQPIAAVTLPEGRMRDRVERSRGRLAEARSANPERVVRALEALDADLARAFSHASMADVAGASEATAARTTSVARLGEAARDLSAALDGGR